MDDNMRPRAAVTRIGGQCEDEAEVRASKHDAGCRGIDEAEVAASNQT